MRGILTVMKTAKSSYFGVGLSSLAFAALLALQTHLPLWKKVMAEAPSESIGQGLQLFFCYCAAIILVIACSYLRTYVLTKEGIAHYFVGIRYRVTPWSDIRDISRVYVAPKRGLELLVIRKNAEILRPRTRGFSAGLIQGNFKTQYLPSLTGHIFTLKNREDILECIKLYYGELDFDLADVRR